MSKREKPTQSSGKEDHFAGESSPRCPREVARRALVDPAGNESDEWIGHQEAAGDAEQLRHTTGSGWIEHRQAGGAFRQIEGESRKPATRAQYERDCQYAKVLQGQRDRRKRKRQRYARA